MTNYAQCVAALYPDHDWVMGGTEYEGLDWLDDAPKPSKEELDAAWPQIKYDGELEAVRAKRRIRYLNETDPMFMKVQRGEDGITLEQWKKAVAQIKKDLPYPKVPK
jgi:hypothetical protein